MIKSVFIQRRPGADSQITDSMLIEVGDVVRRHNLAVIYDSALITDNTLILALGGDGTMLTALRIASRYGSYVSGFNYGNLGYLVPDCATTTKGLVDKLDKLLDGKGYVTTNYSMPVLNWHGNIAINDFYFIPKKGEASDFHVSIGEDDSFFRTKSSGIVITTPFGSTGLALSAGGSILSPNSRVLEAVAVAPHTLTARPIIFPDSDVVKVSWTKKTVDASFDNQNIRIFADGQKVDLLGADGIEIVCKERTIKVIRPEGWDFFENLKKKMGWYS